MVEVLLPAMTIVICLILVVVPAKQNPWLLKPLMVGFLLRSMVALVHAFLFELPQGASDAKVFDWTARMWSSDGCAAFFHHFDPSGSYVYSALLSSFYGCLGYSTLAAQFINVGSGLVSIVFLSLAAKSAWGVSAGKRAAYLSAMFPALVLYSAMTLREAAIVMLLSIGICFVVMGAMSGRARHKIIAMFSLASMAIFHGAMAVALVGYLVALVRQKLVSSSDRRSIAANGLIVMILVSGGGLLLALTANSLFIPKIGLVGELDVAGISGVLANRAQGDAAYLVGLGVTNPLDIVWQAPLRAAYLLFAPFPWNISSLSHVYGFVDGAIYLFLASLYVRNRKALKKHPAFWPLAIIFVCLLMTFAFGTSNFGTGMRHRAKIAGLLIVIVAVYIPRLRFGRRSRTVDQIQ